MAYTLYPELLVSHFDGFEIHPLEFDNEKKCYYILDEWTDNANMYGLYVHLKDGGIECIADCNTPQDAQRLQELFEAAYRFYSPLEKV